MPKVNLIKKKQETEGERMTRIFRASMRYSMALRLEEPEEVARQTGVCTSTFYLRLRDASTLTARELLLLRDRFTDRQLCEMFGVPYHGATRESIQEEAS